MTQTWLPTEQTSRRSFCTPADARPPVAELSDAELCAQIRVHTPDSNVGRDAFGELFVRHYSPALYLALRLNRDRSRAEDAVSEAFSKIWRAWARGSGPQDSFKAYLMTAVRSETYRRSATTKATTTVEPEVLSILAGSSPEDHADELTERDQLARAFKELPDNWQSAITLIDIEDTPTSAAAQALGLSPNSFNSLLHRAREGLRTAYLQQHVEPSSPDCAEYSSELARYVRHQLGRRLNRTVEKHLRRCQRCSRQSTRLSALNTKLRAWVTPAAIAAALIHFDRVPMASETVLGSAGWAGTETAFGTGSDPGSGAVAQSGAGSGAGSAQAAGTAAQSFQVTAQAATMLKLAGVGLAATAVIAGSGMLLSQTSPDAETSASSTGAPVDTADSETVRSPQNAPSEPSAPSLPSSAPSSRPDALPPAASPNDTGAPADSSVQNDRTTDTGTEDSETPVPSPERPAPTNAPPEDPEPTVEPEPTASPEPEPTESGPTTAVIDPPTTEPTPDPTEEPKPVETEEPDPGQTDEPGPSQTEEPDPGQTDEPDPNGPGDDTTECYFIEWVFVGCW